MPPLPRVKVVLFTPSTARYVYPPGFERGTELGGESLDAAYQDGGDISKRLDHLINTIKRANGILGQVETDTIRLFVAPEWFFRRMDSPYSLSETTKMLTSLIKQSSSPPLSSWIIAPGTVLWGKKNGEKWTVYNMAPVVFNGQLLSVVHKRDEGFDIPDGQRNTYQWGIYDLNNSPTVITPEIYAKRNKKCMEISNEVIGALPKKWKNVDNQGLFSCKGISFALNICADQGGRLKKIIENRVSEKIRKNKRLNFKLENIKENSSSPQGPNDIVINDEIRNLLIENFNEEFAHIHILISCGSQFRIDNVIAKRGGFLVQSDGSFRGRVQTDNLVANVRRNPDLNVTFEMKPTVNSRNVQMSLNKSVSPAGSQDIYTRLFIIDDLLDLNPAPIAGTVPSATSST